MKKIIFLVMVLMLCLNLCACSNISGEKAAELYPDIIGSWGTDPFGEEFVLTLAKDGSCTVLNNPGTWTLDEKHSSPSQVLLTAKTAHLTYNIQLERLQSDPKKIVDSVQLVIMDAKKTTEIYKNDVFNPDGQFVSPQLALQAVPELIGEWGSSYWHEETALIIQEDGTCSFLRQPGKWCLSRKKSTWPRIDIRIKLDSGTQLRGDFYLDDDNPENYMASLDIYDIATGIPVFPINYISDISTPFVINRAIAPVAAEIAAPVIGTWAVEGNLTNPVATFNEDGTCTIRGADGVWTVEYHNMQNFPDSYWLLLAKIDENEYQIDFQNPLENLYHMSIYHRGMVILDPSYVVNVSGD